MSDIKEKVRGFITSNLLMGEAPPELTDEASFMSLGILDSTAVLEVIAFLEQTFHIKLTEEEMLPENLDSFAAIEAYVQRKRAAT